jgi:ParB-like chromosome segregation protein Spo0J
MPAIDIPLEKIVKTHPYPDKQKVEVIRRNIQADGCLDFIEPIEVRLIGQRYHIINGSHRTIAAEAEGYRSIPGYIIY